MNSIQILEKLISFDTVSSNSNLEIISYCEKILKDAGAETTLIKNTEETFEGISTKNSKLKIVKN